MAVLNSQTYTYDYGTNNITLDKYLIPNSLAQKALNSMLEQTKEFKDEEIKKENQSKLKNLIAYYYNRK